MVRYICSRLFFAGLATGTLALVAPAEVGRKSPDAKPEAISRGIYLKGAAGNNTPRITIRRSTAEEIRRMDRGQHHTPARGRCAIVADGR